VEAGEGGGGAGRDGSKGLLNAPGRGSDSHRRAGCLRQPCPWGQEASVLRYRSSGAGVWVGHLEELSGREERPPRNTF
jgi:hypothetical protein